MATRVGAIVAVAVAAAAAAPTPNPFIECRGANACGPECGCKDDNCKDSGPFKYIGKKDNAFSCEQTCVGSTNCSIWIYSSGSQHCWWRSDGQWSTQPQADVTSGCRTSASSGVPAVAGCSCAGPKPTPPPGPPAPFVPSNAPNMNGDYILSLTPHGKDAATKYPIQFKDFPGGVEYFDVYSPPITSLYSQVFWTGLPPVDLPADIVQRYNGKGMAVVGFEVDQVRKGAGPNGEDVSVPINVAYNHHFESGMSGAKSKFERIVFDGPNDPRIAELEKGMGHGIPHDAHYVLRDLAPNNPLPTSQGFGAGNGGEYRMSYHGYAPGFAQVIESPRQLQITPMQIDTWNRDKMNLTGSKFVEGPVPRNSWAPPADSPESLYSGLLECPVTTRIRKIIDASYQTEVQGSGCNADSVIATSAECFEAATKLFDQTGGVVIRNLAVNNASQPSGCSVGGSADDGSLTVIFNSAKSSVKCAAGMSRTAGATSSLVDVKVELDQDSDLATITLIGPSTVWFGVGFHAQAMKDAPWAIIVDGSGMVTERKLADQSPGTELAKSVTVVSDKVTGGNRTVVLTRALKGLTSDHYTFSLTDDTTLPFINAIGSGPKLAFHKDKMPATLSLMPVGGAGACLCALAPKPFGEGSGKLQYVQTSQAADVGTGTINFGNKCAPEPRTDLLAQKNPTCDVRTYVGGQSACHHMFSLLDADQEIPWVDQPLTYQQKFRFWVQPYNASFHTNVKRTTWGIASPVEYDVPKCDVGVPGCSKDSEGNWIHTIRGTYRGGGKLAAAHFHCHAPTCIEMAMYRCNMSEVDVCNETTGELICQENPVYGGTGKINNTKMDEPGYILQPPCIWGDPKYGLEPPVDTTGYMLHTYKTSKANWGHHGEMAWQQMFYF